MIRHIRRRFPSDEGMSLIEVLIAAFILTVALLAMAGVAGSSITSVSDSRQRQLATTKASRAVEAARDLAYEQLFMPAPGVTFDPDGAGPLCAEVTPPLGSGSSPFGNAPFSLVEDGTTVTTTVTQVRAVNLSSGPGGPSVCSDTSEAENRRVTTVVTWTIGSATHEVRETTLITRSTRGLPLPTFSVGPPAVALPMDTEESCFDFTLTNLGSEDRYSVDLPTSAAAAAGYSVVAKIKDGMAPGCRGRRRRTRRSTAGRHPAPPLGTNATLPLRICYTPSGSSTPETFEVVVRSYFDGSVTKTVTTEITSSAPSALQLYLHHGGSGNRKTSSNYTMDSNPTVDPVLPDYDVALDPQDLPGLWLQPSSADSDSDVRWDFQQPTRTSATYGGTAQLTLYTYRFGGATTEPSQLIVSLTKLPGNGNANKSELLVRPPAYPYAQNVTDAPGWVPETFDIPLPTVTLASNEYLRLRVRCVTGSTGDDPRNCHVGYDATSHLSVFRLPR